MYRHSVCKRNSNPSLMTIFFTFSLDMKSTVKFLYNICTLQTTLNGHFLPVDTVPVRRLLAGYNVSSDGDDCPPSTSLWEIESGN